MPEGCAKFAIFKRIILVVFLCAGSSGLAAAQPEKPYRIGVILPGGPHYETLSGMRDGLSELGFHEGKHFVLLIHDIKGEARAVESAARTLEKDNVNLIFALTTPVITNAKTATTNVPIVFTIGSDPVSGGLVESFAKPGGRLTGVHYLVRDLTAKRLEILKEILPRAGRVLTFYDPTNRVASDGAGMARKEAKRLAINLIERHVSGPGDLLKQLEILKSGEADAFFFTPDPMVGSQSQRIIDVTNAHRMPAMFQEQTMAVRGALASYGQNYREIGRLAAAYIHQICKGANPKDLKIETVDKVELVINLRTAKQLDIAIPLQVLARASKVIR